MQKRIIFLIAALVSGFTGWMILLFGHGWVRNYGGDAMVIVFLYALLGCALPRLAAKKKALGIFLLALTIEVIQSLHLVGKSPGADLLIGSTFDPVDIITYAVSVIACFFLDRKSLNGVRSSF